MTLETRFTWEKLVLELKLLRNEDFGSMVPLCIGINSILWPKDNVESCFRQVQFLGFEVLKACEAMSEADRWETLRRLIFEDKNYHITSNRAGEIMGRDVLIKNVLEQKQGHPLPVVFLILHLAQLLDLPLALIQARHHFLLKWVRSGKTIYLDLYSAGRALTDEDLIHILNKSASNLEVWSARQLMQQYLELLKQAFERDQHLNQLHLVYDMILQLDEGNTVILGQRALLRQRLGFTREALSDLKRYFSFVERTHAPSEIQQAWLELEAQPTPPQRQPTDMLH
ncbi:MAG: transglutaminase family protein [Bdellovibrionales bacterium]